MKQEKKKTRELYNKGRQVQNDGDGNYESTDATDHSDLAAPIAGGIQGNRLQETIDCITKIMQKIGRAMDLSTLVSSREVWEFGNRYNSL